MSSFLSPSERARYQRQTSLTEIGLSGQQKLKDSSVLIVGAGGLGCPALLYLASMGVGTIGVVEHDRVDESNLHRQVVYSDLDVGRLKSEVLSERIQNLNKNVKFRIFSEMLQVSNALEFIQKFDLVIDASDNFATRYLVNDACVLAGKPLVSASLYQFEGQISVFNLKNGPCYRCLFPEAPTQDSSPSCNEAGVLGSVPGVLGLLQVTETVKVLLGIGETLRGRLLVFNALDCQFEEFLFQKNSNCKVCNTSYSHQTFLKEHEQTAAGCFSSKREAEIPSKIEPEISSETLSEWISTQPDLKVVDLRTEREYLQGTIPGAVHIPYHEFLSQDYRSQFITKNSDKHVVLFCQRGGRSSRLMQQFLGHKNLFHLRGGYEEWSCLNAI